MNELLLFATKRLTEKQRRNFVKDMGLPVSVFIDPKVFLFQLNRTNFLYNGIEKLNLLKKEYENLGSYEAVINQFDSALKRIVNDISSNLEYQQFCIENFEHLSRVENKAKIYHPDNDQSNFISIDLKQANFQALRWVDPSLVNNHSSYKELLSEYTNSEYVASSKKMRQIIFGNLNPQRQQRIQQHIMSELLNAIAEEGMPLHDAMLASADELIVKYTPEIELQVNAAISKLKKQNDKNINLQFHVVPFKLHCLPGVGHEAYYCKTKIDGKNLLSLHCVPSQLVCETLCYLKGESPMPGDMAFEVDGRIASYLNPLNFTKKLDKKMGLDF
jgi:hypothetical protein